MATILFCDDNPTIRKLIGAAMRATAHHVLFAEDGRRGLAVAEATRPDLVVTDLAMPVMNGLELHDALRGHPELSGVPIAFLTASTQHRMMAQARARRPVGLLLKPFSPIQLRRDVDSMLRGERLPEEDALPRPVRG